jgi:hypothetical protein
MKTDIKHGFVKIILRLQPLATLSRDMIGSMDSNQIEMLKRNVLVSTDKRTLVVKSHSKIFYSMDHCSIVDSNVKGVAN